MKHQAQPLSPRHELRPARFIAATLTVSLGALAGCGGDPVPPDQQVLQRIAEAEVAAEQGEAGALVAMLAEDFVGMGDARSGAASRGIGMAPYPQSRQSTAGAVHAVLARYDEVHLLTRVRDLSVARDSAGGAPTAHATVFVAMSATPIATPQALSSLEASLYRFDVVFGRDGEEWLVDEATWRRARAEDFF